MTDIPTIQFESRLMGYKKARNKDGDWVELRLQVHPEEAAPLNSVNLGQRMQCVVVLIDDDEQPLAPERPKGGELAKRAGMLCNNLAFIQWGEGRGLFETCSGAEKWLRDYCNVDSRAELDHDERAAQAFRNLLYQFESDTGRMAERTR